LVKFISVQRGRKFIEQLPRSSNAVLMMQVFGGRVLRFEFSYILIELIPPTDSQPFPLEAEENQ
jgi:hypothetical protein